MFEFLRPFEDFLIHNFELPGAILATALPFILIFLVIGGIVIAVRVGRNPKAVAKQLSKGVDELKAKQILQKAAALRRKGKYEEAYDLYVQLYKAQGKQKFVSAHEIGMLCKDGAEDDWSLEGREAQPNYWFFESILYTDDPASHYEYGLYLMENANGNHLRSADGANHIYEATQHGHAEAKIRWQKIAKEAAKQSGRGTVPQVRPMVSYHEALKMAENTECPILFYEGGGERLNLLVSEQTKEISIFVGSEGGFEKDEVEKAEAIGVKTATLGKRILRCETAPLAALAVLMNLTGDL